MSRVTGASCKLYPKQHRLGGYGLLGQSPDGWQRDEQQCSPKIDGCRLQNPAYRAAAKSKRKRDAFRVSFSLSKKPAEPQAFFYGMFFHGHVPGKNTVTRQIFAKIWRNRPAGRGRTVEKNPAKRFFDSLKETPFASLSFCRFYRRMRQSASSTCQLCGKGRIRFQKPTPANPYCAASPSLARMERASSNQTSWACASAV